MIESLTISLLYVLFIFGAAALSFGRHLFRGGIDTDLINDVRDQIAPGTSILVLRTDGRTGTEFAALFADMMPTELRTDSLPPEE